MIGTLEASLSRFENAVVLRLSRLNSPLWPFLFSLLIPFIIFLTWPYWTDFDYLKIAHWDIIKSVEVLFIAFVFLSPFATVIKRRYIGRFYFAVAVLSWLVHCYFKDKVLTSDPLTWVAAYAVPVLVCITWLALRWKVAFPKRRAFFLTLFALAAALFVGFVAAKTKNKIYIDLFWGAHVEIFLIVALARLLVKNQASQTDLNLTSNPMNLITGVFWPLDVKDRNDSTFIANKEVWWRGYYTTLTGFLFQLLSMLMIADREVIFSQSQFLGLQWMTVCSFLGLTAVARITTGVARLFGVDVPDASNFVFLSRSPVDTLRRGYVYAYEFNLRYICLPLLRYLRSMWLAVFFTFAFYVVVRFVVQPLLVPLAYNLIFPELMLYLPQREFAADMGRSVTLLAAFFIEPLFVKIRMMLGNRWGDLFCILLTYLLLTGMRMVDLELAGILL